MFDVDSLRIVDCETSGLLVFTALSTVVCLGVCGGEGNGEFFCVAAAGYRMEVASVARCGPLNVNKAIMNERTKMDKAAARKGRP